MSIICIITIINSIKDNEYKWFMFQLSQIKHSKIKAMVEIKFCRKSMSSSYVSVRKPRLRRWFSLNQYYFTGSKNNLKCTRVFPRDSVLPTKKPFKDLNAYINIHQRSDNCIFPYITIFPGPSVSSLRWRLNFPYY